MFLDDYHSDQDNPFGDDQAMITKDQFLDDLNLLQPWQIKPNNEKFPISPSHRLICCSGFKYERSIYDES